MVTVHDADYNIILANKAAEKILNLPILEKMKDKKCFSYYHGTDHAPAGCPSCGCLQSGAPAVFEIFEPHLNMFIEIRAIPRFDSNSKLIGLIHVVRDITERKHLEQQIKSHTEQLETLVFERTRALEDTNIELQIVNKELVLRREEAEAASRSKTDFLANMSHELRTPLNAIMGFSEIMLMGMAGPVSDKQREFLGDISKSGNHLLSLINDILDLSKVEAGKVELETEQVIVGELISGSLMMFKEKALKHAVRVESSIDPAVPQIVADRRKLKQVLVNLLSNAFKFTPDGGNVRVSTRKVASSKGQAAREDIEAGSSALDPDFIEFSVSDTGHGIDPDHQQLLFQPFQQIDSSLTRKHAGTGLGLSLCRRFVELHGGRIWVESEPGKGSTFRFVVPIRIQGETPCRKHPNGRY
jgi:signal transduction histidine kinase